MDPGVHSKDVQLQYYPPSAHLRQSAEGALRPPLHHPIERLRDCHSSTSQSVPAATGSANRILRTGLRFTPESALCLRGIGGGILRRAPCGGS